MGDTRTPGQAFPKERRILKRKDFRLVYDTGNSFRNKGFHVFVRPRDNDGPTRLGLTTPRSVGKSVVRNRLRRWAREFFRIAYPRLAPGRDVVVNFHAGLARQDRREFDRLLEHALRQAHLFQ